ncbi:hypothetical protein B0H12DRAFT_1216019 [Mycena haematopus]|nr:hypothetical protein B0H12DRAFT_1216019 [Mycena haematopus]
MPATATETLDIEPCRQPKAAITTSGTRPPSFALESRMASLYARAAKQNITLHKDYNMVKCPEGNKCCHCRAFYDHIDRLRLENRISIHPDDGDCDGDILPIGCSYLDAVFRLADMRGYLRTSEYFQDLVDHETEADTVLQMVQVVDDRERLETATLVAELETYKQRVKEADERNAQVLMQCRDVAAERDSLRRKVGEIQSGVVAERDRLQHANEGLQRQCNGVAAERDSLRRKVEELERWYDGVVVELDRLGHTVEELQHQRDGVVAEQDRLRHTVEELQHQHDGVVAERDQVRHTNEDLQRQHDGVVVERDCLVHTVKELQRRHARVVAKQDQLVGELQLQYDGVVAERDRLRHMNEGLQRQRNVVVAEGDRLLQTVEELQRRHDGVVVERDRLRETVEELHRQHDGVVAEGNRLLQTIEELQRRHDGVVVGRDRLRETVEELHRQHDGVVAERDRLQQTDEDLRRQNDGVAAERDQLRQTVQELRSQFIVERGWVQHIVGRGRLQQTVPSEAKESASHSQHAPNLKRKGDAVPGANSAELRPRKRLAISDGFATSLVPFAS